MTLPKDGAIIARGVDVSLVGSDEVKARLRTQLNGREKGKHGEE